ncbi:MAG TPA: hypothetical protein VF516_15760 [Kofleriaceae bacterium]
MTYIAFIVTGLFLMKILWNVTVPYTLAVRSFRAKDGESRGISLLPFVELALLGVAAGLSLTERGSPWSWSIGTTVLVGGAIAVASYVHLIIAGAIAGWVVKKLRARRGR